MLKDYNVSVANKEGLQLATEGANVSCTVHVFARLGYLGVILVCPRQLIYFPAEKKRLFTCLVCEP